MEVLRATAVHTCAPVLLDAVEVRVRAGPVCSAQDTAAHFVENDIHVGASNNGIRGRGTFQGSLQTAKTTSPLLCRGLVVTLSWLRLKMPKTGRSNSIQLIYRRSLA